ncbi:hypothetical protein ASJ35_14265 [Ruthenibacterium lactatiformans]|uniref:Uncharacterized protein n=2 Tax=Ruthenibacterium lactatiformans TaxID=1550024 RepID=A0A0W7TNF9_9FIRM|nr:hypothetical protein ASJ35_14265 [Ruthenibacterium lactatiformans]
MYYCENTEEIFSDSSCEKRNHDEKGNEKLFLRMAVVLLVLGAVCFVGAYGAGKLCAEMLLTPACAALAYAAYQAEKNLFRPAPKAPVLRVAAKEQTPMRVA